MSKAKERYIRTIPSVYKPGFNRVITAFIVALANSQDTIEEQIQAGKDQNFVRTATGQPLDKLAKGLGVSRPPTLGLTDEEFQNLIPNLSLKPKQIKKAFYDTADVFFGPLFSRSNVTTRNTGPFNLNVGDEIKIKVDGGNIQTVKVLTGDIAAPGLATAEEVVALFNKLSGITPSILEDSLTGDKSVNIRTNTPGSVGTIEIITSSGIGTSKLDFLIKEYDILDLPQRVSVYNINPNELIIELPAIVPALRRTLKGSHHFHEDGTLQPPKGINQGVWQGSFLFDPNGTGGTFTVTGQKAILQQEIQAGQVYTSIVVDDTSKIVAPNGQVIFNFGGDQEVPVGYRGIPNANTILLDPSYTFTKDHPVGSQINVISEQKPYVPRRNGDDLAIYLTSPSDAREIVQQILETLKAAGIIIKFVILAPKYKYLIDNVYLSDDDAPTW